MKIGFFTQLEPKPDEDAGLLIQYIDDGGAYLAVMKPASASKPKVTMKLTRKQCLTLSRLLEEASKDYQENEWNPEKDE